MKGEEKGFTEGERTPADEEPKKEKKSLFYHENGKTYFSRSTERLIFFVLTLIMVLVVVLAKLGVLG